MMLQWNFGSRSHIARRVEVARVFWSVNCWLFVHIMTSRICNENQMLMILITVVNRVSKMCLVILLLGSIALNAQSKAAWAEMCWLKAGKKYFMACHHIKCR